MLGAVAGDIIGSVYEGAGLKATDFPLFHPRCRPTDDSVLTLAVAEAIMTERPYGEVIREFARRYPDAGYGGRFYRWFQSGDSAPYNSFGNGSAMRVSPVGFAFDSRERVLEEAEATALPTHNHPEGVKGAKAVALAAYLGRTGAGKAAIRRAVSAEVGYDLSGSPEEIRPGYAFDVTCQGSVPEAIICFLETDSWESAVRTAISLGGDADTQACIAGAIADAFYGGLPGEVEQKVFAILPEDLSEVARRWKERYPR
jgi:ADP-ribosylglycohydrolase